MLDETAQVLQSDDILAEIKIGILLLNECELFVGMDDLILNLNDGEELRLDCIETDFFGRHSIFDFLFKRVDDEKGGKNMVLLIHDLEEVYQRVISLRQERNEAQMYATQLQIAHDKLKEAQLQLVANERMASVGLLAAGMSHEINNPLNYIFNGAALAKRHLDEDQLDDEHLNQMISIIEEGAERIKLVTGQLKIFDHSSQKEEKMVDIHQLIDYSIDLIKHRITDETEIVSKYTNEEVLIQSKSGRINQVFFNLLLNAYNFTREVDKPRIVVKTVCTDQIISVQVEDNGVGISDDIREQIFEPFFSTKKIAVGKGLGLSVTKMILKEYNGELFFESEKGSGTVFYVKLPKK